MAQVAIVSYDVQTIYGRAGGVAAFTTRWAHLLQQAGESVTIVMTRAEWDPMRVDLEWRARFQASGINLIEIQAPPGTRNRWPEVPTVRVSEMVAPVLKGFDVVYFQDWGNSAFHLVRQRRYAPPQRPACVTVLHGPSEWELSSNHRYPKLPDDLHLAYQERYAARHCDLVVSPSQYMVDHLTQIGWDLPAGVEVAGLPMLEPASGETPSYLGASAIRRIVCFAQVEERKGIRNFVKALQHLAQSLDPKPEVILLGGVHPNDGHLLEFALGAIHQAGYNVIHKNNLDSEAAREYLRRVAEDTLCVVPSPADNHPYAVVEASLIPGLNLVVTTGGGVPEVLGSAPAQTCRPHAMDLAAKMADRLCQPLRVDELARYDCAAANRRWLALHDRALALAAKRSLSAPSIANPVARPSVDVCFTYYRQPRYLAQLVEALECQTETDFHVIAVNDGSPDEESNRVFEHFADRVKPRGWDFFLQENAFVDAARNSAARRGTAEFILFIDGDDLPAYNAVARLREAILRCGDDVVAPAMYLFASEDSPFDPATREVRVPAFATIVPLGIDLVGGIVNPSVFPGSMFIVRRSVFEQMGGFRERRGAGSEDWEFYVRTVLEGYKVDILPELLLYYRQVEGSLSRTLLPESSTRRILDAYEDILRPLGLHGAALALSGLHRASVKLERRVDELSVKVQPLAPFSYFSGASRHFETGENKRVEVLRRWYRRHVSMEMRLRLHRVLLEPFFGPYKVSNDKPPSA